MVLSILDSKLLSLILYGYSKGIPIIEAAVEKENILRIIIELYKSPDSKLSINNNRDINVLHEKGILNIHKNKYILSKTGEDIARKLEKEIDIYRKHYDDIDLRNLNLDRILKILCNELIVSDSLVGYRFYPIFQVIYENYNESFLTPKLIGRYGFVLLVLYNGENKCNKCRNWALSLKDIRDYLSNQLSMNCYNKFGWKIDANYLSTYELVTQRGHYGNFRYKLTEYGHNVSEYIIKNLVIAYRHLEEKVGFQ
jgi:hypothetical protein